MRCVRCLAPLSDAQATAMRRWGSEVVRGGAMKCAHCMSSNEVAGMVVAAIVELHEWATKGVPREE